MNITNFVSNPTYTLTGFIIISIGLIVFIIYVVLYDKIMSA